MRVASCPPIAELKRLFLGGLSEQQAQAHEEHVLGCGACLEKLKTLVPTPDTLAGWFSAETHCDGFVSSPVVADLVKQLKALRPASARSDSQGAAMIRVTCTSCQKKLSIKETLAGKKVKCPGCGQVVAVPTPVACGDDRADDRTLPPDPAPVGTEQPSVAADKRPTRSSANVLDATIDTKEPDSRPDSSLTDFLSPPQSAGELGRLGKYRILKVLGQGGMGVVYKAEDPLLKRNIALKAMLPTLAASASAGKRFLREAQAMAAVEHDHVVRVLEVAEERGVPFLAMEFLKGEPLDVRLERDKVLPVLEVVRIGKEIAEGLAAAHEHGLIHRDIKPANIWLEAPRGRVKILDFGLARSAEQESGLTQQGAIIGTPAYMAPEQGRGDAVDGRCDLFSLGVILYRLSSGQPAFRGKDTISTLMAVATEQPPPPCAANPELPAELSDLVMQLLEKDPQRRPASAAAVAESLQSLEQKLRRAQEPHGQTQMVHTPAKRAAAPIARRRLPVQIGVAVLLIALVGLGLWASGIIRFQSDQGDYVIQTDDPDFSFQVAKGGGVTLKDRKTERTYTLKVLRQDMKTGVHELEVTDVGADLSFKTPTLTIKRGETVALKAWFERKQTVAVAPPVPPGDDAWLKAVAALPAAKQVELVAARLKECNPGFDGKVTHRIEGGKVISLEVPSRLVQDLTPLRALTGLRDLTCRGTLGYDNKAESDAAVLRLLQKLENINGKPVAEFRKEVDARQVEFKEWLKRIPALAVTQQLDAVVAKLKERNPGFDGSVKQKIEGGVVTELYFVVENVTDLSPLRALPGLRRLSCVGSKSGGGQLSDLSPLKDMRLTSLFCFGTKVSDLSPLQGMPLTNLSCHSTPVSDLSPLQGMPLTNLSCYYTAVSDLSPLKGMPLTLLHCYKTKVSDLSPLKDMQLTSLSCWGTQASDLSPLKGMPLEDIRLTPKANTKGLDILRDMKSLKTIGIGKANTQVWPAAEFWDRYDKGEFKQ